MLPNGSCNRCNVPIHVREYIFKPFHTVTHVGFICRVVKSRLQAGQSRYKSSLHGLATILKEEGIQGLYKGIGSKLIQSVLTAAILFAGQRRIYELTKKVGYTG